MSKELKVGDKAPNFKLPTDSNGQIHLEEFKGSRNVVLYFYPKDDTPGCTIEANEFRRMKDDFAEADTIIIGISKDPVENHDKFKDKFKLNFPLASDKDTYTAEDYGTWVEKNMYGKKYMGIQRDTFLIGKDGKIAHIWRKVKPEGHAKEVLETVRNLLG